VAGVPSALLVDSGAWIALFSARDRHHAEADAMFRAAAGGRARLVTTTLILAEVHRFFLFRAGIGPAAHALGRIEASRLVSIVYATEAHHRAGHAWLARLGDQIISYTDAVSFAVMSEAGCHVAMSFDRDFAVAGFPLWQPLSRRAGRSR